MRSNSARKRTLGMLDFAKARRTMVDCQVRTFDVTDRAIIAAMEELPRERFMPAGREALSYSDQTITIPIATGSSRCMLQPMVLARMIQALGIRVGTRVLDVASGLGYGSAVLARLGATVTALEPDERLAASSRDIIGALGLPGSVDVKSAPLDEPTATEHGFDAILVNGTVEARPTNLLEQLAEGGRLACIKSDGRASHAMIYVRGGEGIGSRLLFNASAPLLDEFRPAPAFAF